MDLFQPNLAQSWSIQSDVAHRLAITFGLTVTDVRADARDVATWHGTDDDLATAIGARRRLGVQDAATYLRNLQPALDESRRGRARQGPARADCWRALSIPPCHQRPSRWRAARRAPGTHRAYARRDDVPRSDRFLHDCHRASGVGGRGRLGSAVVAAHRSLAHRPLARATDSDSCPRARQPDVEPIWCGRRSSR